MTPERMNHLTASERIAEVSQRLVAVAIALGVAGDTIAPTVATEIDNIASGLARLAVQLREQAREANA